jgi:hypothetical protein
MPCFVLPQQVEGIAAVFHRESLGATEQRRLSSGTSASGRANLRDIQVGTTRYFLQTELSLEKVWDGAQWVCWSPNIGAECSGKASSIGEAQDEWAKQVHASFQRLYAMRPVHMSPNEAALWARLESVVDVCTYRDTTPIALREIGRVRYGRFQYPHTIEWIHGRKDTINLNQAPAELAGCKIGQWIEADVLRQPRTGLLLGVQHIQQIKSPPRVDDARIEELWKALPAAELPESEWDELTS